MCPHDPRPLRTRHGDALAILGHEHHLVCECGRDACQAAQRPARQAKNIELVVQLPALISSEDIPALLDGAPIDSELAQTLAKAAKRIKFTTDPEQYKPTPNLEVHVNVRDQHCPSPPALEALRRPGRRRRARTELDHTTPFNHEDPSAGGLTIPDNLRRLCRHHHRAKTHAKWKDRQHPDGTVEWVSPSGQRYVTSPG